MHNTIRIQFSEVYCLLFLGSGSNRGQTPVEWEKILFVDFSVPPPLPAGPQTPPVGPYNPLSGAQLPLTGRQTPLAGRQTPLAGPEGPLAEGMTEIS